MKILAGVIVCLLAGHGLVRAGEATDWAEESNGGGVIIQSRIHEGSTLREFKAAGIIEAPPGLVFAVLDDAENYPSFMPYTSEVRILKREKNRLLAYQRLDPPFVSDRDYTLASRSEKWFGPEGLIYRIRWEEANALGPAERAGVVRVTICEGGWLLEPESNGSTRATYSIFTDNGGTLPSFVAHSAGRVGIRKIFDAVRKRVKDPKLATAARVAN